MVGYLCCINFLKFEELVFMRSFKCPPPANAWEEKYLEIKLIAASILTVGSLLNIQNAQADVYVTENNVLIIRELDWTNKSPTAGMFTSNKSYTYSGLEIKHNAYITGSQFTIDVDGGSDLSINGDTRGMLTGEYNTGFANGAPGNHIFLIHNRSSLNLAGNVNLEIRQVEGPESIGANLLYVRDSSKTIVGTESSTVKMWAIAQSPDLLSAKYGNSSVIFLSTHNQLVGTIDMMDDKTTTDQSAVSITFSGPNSYWFGDEKTWMNSDWEDSGQQSYKDWIDNGGDRFDLKFENGAQWTYLGIQSNRSDQYTTPKRISSITLNGGIINLFDANIETYWKNLGLWDLIQNDEFDMAVEGKHDYVRIGNLKGNGGIFRLDLDAINKSQSDMVYLESGEGTHYFEPYNLNLLHTITPENTLTFALVAKGNTVQFKDKQNLYGETLYDYELEIASDKISEEDLNDPENAYWDKTSHIDESSDAADQATKIDMDEFIDGTNWFIRRVTLKESAATIGMTGAGYASYDAAVEMDRRDRRLYEKVYASEDHSNGLWVRMSHGRSGAENQYHWDRTGVTVGFDHNITKNNRLGIWFGYTEGDTDFLDVRGSGEMKRYEFALYDTLTFGASYLDFVTRFGQVSSDFNVGNLQFNTDGNFDQKYAALSAEAGYKLADTNGVYVEPQVQVQLAYLHSYDYKTERSMSVDADSEISVIARAGFRAGREISTMNYGGEVYFHGDVYHQFTDGQEAEFSDNANNSLVVNWGDTGTWSSFGIGTAWNWKNCLGLKVDIERTVGGKVEDTWLLSGRLNYNF